MGFVRKRGKSWQAGYWGPDHKQHTKTFRLQDDARKWLATGEADKARGTWLNPSLGKQSFETYAEVWRGLQLHRPTTEDQVKAHLKRHVYPTIGARAMSSFRPSDIQALVRLLVDKGLAPSTIEVVMTWVRTIFKAAVRDRVIAVNPCEGVRLPAVPQRKALALPQEVIQSLVTNIEPRYRCVLIVGLGTGARIAEALGLTEDRIDFKQKSVTIDRQLSRRRGNVPAGNHGVSTSATPIFGPVKDKQNTPRTIPVPQELLTEVRAHIATYGLGPSGLIFTGRYGGPVSQTTFNDAFRRAADTLGIPKRDGFHRLRHTYASSLIQDRLSLPAIQHHLGHTSAQMTLDVYGHLMADDADRTRVAVSSLITKALAAP